MLTNNNHQHSTNNSSISIMPSQLTETSQQRFEREQAEIRNQQLADQVRGRAYREIENSKNIINKELGVAERVQDRKIYYEQELERWQQVNQSFITVDAGQHWMYLSVLLSLPVVVFLNLVLITRPVEYLAIMAFGENSTLVEAVKIIIPIFLLLLELAINSNIYYLIQSNQSTLYKMDQLRKWKIAGTFMIAFTPLMILGTTWARIQAILMSGGSLEGIWPTIFINLPLIVLAGVTDFVIVYSGEIIHEARGYFWFRFVHHRLQEKIYHYRRRLHRALEIIEKQMNLCHIIANTYNEKYPYQQPILITFSDRLKNFIDEHGLTVKIN